MQVPGDSSVEEAQPARDWGAEVETSEADRREQDTPVVTGSDPDPETIVHRSALEDVDPSPLDSASEFDAIDQAIEVPYDDEDR